MTNTLRNRILIGATAGVMALATMGAVEAQTFTTTYKLGFVDGCDLAKYEAGYPIAASGKRLPGNSEYEGAWTNGYAFCMFNAQQEVHR